MSKWVVEIVESEKIESEKLTLNEGEESRLVVE